MEKYNFVLCLSCGDPINNVAVRDEDDIKTQFCPLCLNENDELKSYGEILEIEICKIMKLEKVSYQVARNRANAKLSVMPHWKLSGMGTQYP